MQLVFQGAGDPVDFASALHGRALGHFIGPTQDVGVFVHAQKLAAFVHLPFGGGAIPRPNGHVGNGVGVATDEAVVRQALVQHVQLAFDLHGKAVNGVFDFERCVGIEMAKAATQIGRTAHLPKQPRQAFGALRHVSG